MRNRSVRRLIFLSVVICGTAILLAPVGAIAKRPHRRPARTQITIRRWDGETLGGTRYHGKPHERATHCASDPAKSLNLYGFVKHAVSGRNIVVRYLLNGQVRDIFHEHWVKSGFGRYDPSIYNESGLPDGRWTLRVYQGRRLIGGTWVVLAADPSC